MKFQPKTYILKTGHSIKIRIPALEEAQRLIDLKRSYIKNTTTIPMNLDEYTNNEKNELSLITEFIKSQNSILLVAEFNHELIGNIDLTGSKRTKMFYWNERSGKVGWAILPHV